LEFDIVVVVDIVVPMSSVKGRAPVNVRNRSQVYIYVVIERDNRRSKNTTFSSSIVRTSL
jgi:hypothetical protein